MTDKRVIKTKSAIKKAFMELMYQKDISKITVSDIAERALINRSTFYLHYGDVQAVWNEIEDEIAEHISADVSKFDINDVSGSTYKLFNSLSNNIDDMDAVNKFILNSTNSKYIIERIKEIMIKASLDGFPDNNGENKPEAKLLITFIASGAIDTYIKWADSDQKDVNLDLLCEVISVAIQSIVDLANKL